MRSIMRSARIALYKSKKIANRLRHCAFHGFSLDGIDRDTQARGGERDCATVNGHLLVVAAIGKIRRMPVCENIAACSTAMD
ncbi:TPA: hypothetical protein ACKFM7_000254 [Burkholderia contaminans]